MGEVLDEQLHLVSSRGAPFERRFYLYAVAIIAALIGASVVVASGDSYPRVVAVMCLAGFVLIAEHRDCLFGDETSISGGVVIAMAGVVVFRNDSYLFGPFACGLVAGLY